MDDRALVSERLGRAPMGEFDVVVRDETGAPGVIRNAPFLTDGTPMPTRYWLVDTATCEAVARLEAGGRREGGGSGHRARHPRPGPRPLRRRPRRRDPRDHAGPRPYGGVGGTRRGVKCLHAHYAWHLAGGDDPVGRWVAERLES